MESALLFLENYKNQRIIDELEAIRAEMEIIREDCSDVFVARNMMMVLDKHICKLKGETNESSN